MNAATPTHVSPLILPEAQGDAPGRIAGRSLDEWNAAYAKVESYFHALARAQQSAAGPVGDPCVAAGHAARAPASRSARPPSWRRRRWTALVTEWFGAGAARAAHRRGPDALDARPAGAAAGGHARQMAGPVPAARPLARGICPGPCARPTCAPARTSSSPRWPRARWTSAPSPRSPRSAACPTPGWWPSGCCSRCCWSRSSSSRTTSTDAHARTRLP